MCRKLVYTSKPEFKKLDGAEWKQAHEVDLPAELQCQPAPWLMSHFFHSDGEGIGSFCKDPKYQRLTMRVWAVGMCKGGGGGI